jgi:Ca2+-binding RTX toxin-like protein
VGGLGDDTYVVDAADTVIEQADGGQDTVRSTASHVLGDHLEVLVPLGAANTTGTGNALDNRIVGTSGNNTLAGMAGADTLVGGAGIDTYVIDSRDAISEAAGAGTDTVQADFSYTLGNNLENLVLLGSTDLTGTGNALSNRITGTDGANLLNGGAGADTLTGGAGDDTFVTDGGDTIIEAAGGGTDTVRSSANHTLALNVEHLVLTGTGTLSGTGNGLANQITGTSGANTLNGGAGADTLTGGGGADVFVFLTVNDSRAAVGIDLVTDFSFAAGDRIDVSALDANAGLAGDQAFNTLIAAGTGFTVAGQYRATAIAGGVQVEFNTDADAAAEFAIDISTAATPTAGWFVL